MKHVKLFKESQEDPISFEEAFKKYILNRSVISTYYGTPLVNNGDNFVEYYALIEGIKFDNNYIWASHGGGCSGEDCNTTFIISPENKVIASFNW